MNSSAQYICDSDVQTTSFSTIKPTTKQLSRPLDVIISTFGEGKDYSELFKMENGCLVDETLADQIAQDTFKIANKYLDELKRQRDNGRLDQYIFQYNKYTILEAETQYKSIIEALKNAGFSDEESNKKEEEKEEAKSEEAKDPIMDAETETAMED